MKGHPGGKCGIPTLAWHLITMRKERQAIAHVAAEQERHAFWLRQQVRLWQKWYRRGNAHGQMCSCLDMAMSCTMFTIETLLVPCMAPARRRLLLGRGLRKPGCDVGCEALILCSRSFDTGTVALLLLSPCAQNAHGACHGIGKTK